MGKMKSEAQDGEAAMPTSSAGAQSSQNTPVETHVEHTFGSVISLDGVDRATLDAWEVSQQPLMPTFQSAKSDAAISAQATGRFSLRDIEAVNAFWHQHSNGNTAPWMLGGDENDACKSFIELFPWHAVESMELCFTKFRMQDINPEEAKSIRAPLAAALCLASKLKSLKLINCWCSFFDQEMVAALRCTVERINLFGNVILLDCKCRTHHMYSLFESVAHVVVVCSYYPGKTEHDLTTILTRAAGSLKSLDVDILQPLWPFMYMPKMVLNGPRSPDVLLPHLRELKVKMASSIDGQYEPSELILRTPNIKEVQLNPRAISWLRHSAQTVFASLPALTLILSPRYSGGHEHMIAVMKHFNALSALIIDTIMEDALGLADPPHQASLPVTLESILTEMALQAHIPLRQIWIAPSAPWKGHTLSALVLSRRYSAHGQIEHVCAHKHSFDDFVVALLRINVPRCKLEAV